MANVRVVAFPGWVAAVNADHVAVLEPGYNGETGITWITLRDGRKIASPIALREALMLWTGNRLTSSEREAAIEAQAQALAL